MNHPTNATVDLSADEAIDLTTRIREKVGEIWPLIVEAFERRAWTALGLPSWADYCAAHLRGMVPALDRGERQSKVAELRDAGFSTRAIGSALGVADQTVRADLAQVRDFTQQPTAVVGVDGKAYAPTRPVPAPAEEPLPPLTAVQREQVEQHVVGRDGLAARANTPEPVEAPEPVPAEPSMMSVDTAEQDLAYKHDATKTIIRAIGDLWAVFDPDPVAALERKWVPGRNHLSTVSAVAWVYQPDGLRRIAEHLTKLADHLEANGGDLL